MATPKRLAGPTSLSATLTTNVYQGGGASPLVYDVIKHIHVANHTAQDATFTLYLGATGANVAGTELFWQKTVKAGDTLDWYCNLKLTSTDFLVGGAGTASALTITVMGEQVVV